ncbi:MAG TPA: DNA polymerase III subunit delta [Candidatus Cloacimonadota bacterium]|nr:DNA polymerase III subunit delta [Candidatus Cloacimonadota bacterium]
MPKSFSVNDFNKAKIGLGESYLIVGNDSFWMDKIASRIRNELVIKAKAELVTLYGNETKLSMLNDILDSISLFSTTKLIMIRNAEDLGKKELEYLAGYLQNPAEEQTLLITAEKIDGKLGAWKKIKETTNLIQVEKPKFMNQMKEWLEAELKTIGKTMSPKAIEEFTSRIELDYSYAYNELQKVILMAGEQKGITEADIFRSLGTTRTGTVIDFQRALGKRNQNQSLSMLQKMIDNDWEPLQILFQLRKFFLTIWKINLLKSRHISDAEIISTHLQELFPSQKREYLGFAAAYKLPSIRKAFELLLVADHQLKSAGLDGSLILILSLTKILNS